MGRDETRRNHEGSFRAQRDIYLGWLMVNIDTERNSWLTQDPCNGFSSFVSTHSRANANGNGKIWIVWILNPSIFNRESTSLTSFSQNDRHEGLFITRLAANLRLRRREINLLDERATTDYIPRVTSISLITAFPFYPCNRTNLP